MNEVTYLDEVAPGVEEYEAKFGPFEPDEGIPYQLDVENMAEAPIIYCKEFGILLKGIAEQGRKIQPKEYIDLFWKRNGVYSAYGVTTKDYDTFVKKVSAMDIML